MDFLHNTAFTKVVIAQSMVKDKDSGREKGKLRCIKIYREGCPSQDTLPELKAETKAYQRLSEAAQNKLPGFQFLMQLQALCMTGVGLF